MTDIATLVLAVDSTQVKTGAASLDGLTAAGVKAEAATLGLGKGSKAAGAEATAMAVAAQASARAVMGQAQGFTASAQAARLNTVAMRETLVVARELSRGNFTRLPGSLSLLAQGVGSQGGFGAYASALANMLGLTRKVQDAELAEAAVAAESAATGVRAAAERAGANIMAADTEIALAEAQVRVAEGAVAEAVAQARLVAAHEAVAVAAGEAAVAENALATAEGRSMEAGAANAAATRTLIGGGGVGLLGLSIVAGVAYGAIKEFQDQVRDSGALDEYADKLNLTDAQIKKLGGSVTYLGHNIKEVHGLTVSFGDVMYGVWHEIAREVSDPGPWNAMANNAATVFDWMLGAWSKVSAGISAGLMSMGHFILEMGKGGMHGADLSKMDPLGDLQRRYADELKRNQVAFAGIKSAALAHAEKTLQDLHDGNNPRAPKKSRKVSDHGLQEAIDKLEAEIKGQYALAAAYDVSAAAAQRAEAQQKAAEDAISHKGRADQFYALELQKIVATDVARQARENAGLQAQLSIRSRLNAALADGTITVGQYSEKLAFQTKLQTLNADLENADAAHKRLIIDLIQRTIDLNTQDLQLKAQLNALTEQAANDNEIARLQLEAKMIGASNKERAIAIAQLEAMQKLKEIDPNGLLTVGDRAKFVQSAVEKAVAGVRSPLQQWAASIPQTAAAVNEALQSIQVRGFDSLASSIADVVTGTKSLKSAFKDVAKSIIGDIVQMTVKMLIFRALSSVFGGLGGGAAPTASANGNVFSGGNVIPFASGGVVGGPTMFPMRGGRTGLMGEAGPEAVMPLARDGQGRLGVRAANNNSSGPIEVRVALDVAASPELDVKIATISAVTVQRAAPVIVRVARDSTIKSLGRKSL